MIDLSDYYIDNCSPIGDGSVKMKNGYNVSAVSTIFGSFVLNSIISEVATLAIDEEPFPFYTSTNSLYSKNNNNLLIEKYKNRNFHL